MTQAAKMMEATAKFSGCRYTYIDVQLIYIYISMPIYNTYSLYIYIFTKNCHTVDGRNPANQLRWVVYPTIYKVIYIYIHTLPRWLALGFLNHQQYYLVVVSIIFYFHPYLGKIPVLTHIFQMDWSHQPVVLWESIKPQDGPSIHDTLDWLGKVGAREGIKVGQKHLHVPVCCVVHLILGVSGVNIHGDRKSLN